MEGITIMLDDVFSHLSVGYPVAITVDDLCITISFRVVGHSQGHGKIELAELEVVTESRIEVQVTVLREGILRPEVDPVSETTGVDEWRHAEGGVFCLCSEGSDQMLTDGIPKDFLQQVLLLRHRVDGNGIFLMLQVVFGIDAFIRFGEWYDTQGVHHLTVGDGT